MKKFLVAALTLSMVFASVACSSNVGGAGKEGVLIADLGSIMPSSNTTPTEENPEVFLSTSYIAQDYTELTGVQIEWAKDYGRNVGATQDGVGEWYSQAIQGGYCPAIGFTWGNGFQERDYYVTLDEYLERPNPYVKGNTRWKDIFLDYVWEDSSLYDINGNIVAIPVLLTAGSQTAIFYNKTLFAELEEKNYIDGVPGNWDEYLTTIEALEAEGHYTIAPYVSGGGVGLYQWPLSYMIAPNFLEYMKDDGYYNIDYDQDGTLTNLEILRGVVEGKFDPTVEGPARDAYLQAVEYYADYLPDGWLSTDFTQKWDGGNLGMKENGIWYISTENSNTARKFEYGMFASPLLDSKTSKYAADTVFVKGTEVEAPVSISLNVMKAGANTPEKIEAAIDFLMYLTATDAVSEMANEKPGTIGAVKDTTYSATIDEWLQHDFPVISNSAKWPDGYTSTQNSIINKSFSDWVEYYKTGTGKMNDSEFFRTVKAAQRQGALDFIEIKNVDTTGWSGLD